MHTIINMNDAHVPWKYFPVEHVMQDFDTWLTKKFMHSSARRLDDFTATHTR